ncbi:response regulator [Mucilaginibacter antarcticus]|uniref:Response regulator n=1 Tax=Mucilaginibacter antarcticus TaxID=1855725 RepID=A0ABW5XT94_9SPHI
MIRVLIADDHHVVRCGIRQLLENENGFIVSGEAADGNAALKLLENGVEADVLLADVNMPGMDGLELTRNIRQTYPELKIVLLTMQEEESYIQKAFGAGVQNYVFKTAGTEEVIFALKQAASGKSYVCSSLTERLIKQSGEIHSTSQIGETSDIKFSKREMEVIELMAEGHTNEEIADKLFTSRRTVEGHRQAMIDKTGCRNSLALIRFAMRHRLLQ